MAYENTKETSQKIRNKLKKEFGYLGLGARHFSVRSHHHGSITVSWEDYPSEQEVEEIISKYKGISFDGMIDLEDRHGYTDPDTGEHVASFNYVHSDYNMTQKRVEKLEKRIKEIMPDYDSYSDREKYRILYDNNVKYDIDGNLKDEYKVKEFSAEDLNYKINRLVDKYINDIELDIPYTYLSEKIKGSYYKNGKFYFGEDENKLKDSLVEYISKELSDKEFINTESLLEEHVKWHVLNSRFKLPYFKSLKGAFISDTDAYANEHINDYMKTRDFYDLNAIRQVMPNNSYINFGDFMTYELDNSIAKAFESYESLLKHALLKLFRFLDGHLKLEDISPKSTKNIEKIIEESRTYFSKIKYSYEDYKISPIAIHFFRGVSYSGNKPILDGSTEKNENKVLAINTQYPDIASIFRKYKSTYSNESKNSEFENMDERQIREHIYSHIREDILELFVSWTKFVFDSRLDYVLVNILKEWAIKRDYDINSFKNNPELFNVDNISSGKIGNLLESSVDLDRFLDLSFKKFDSIVNVKDYSLEVSNVRNNILKKELVSLKENPELVVRMNKILNKQISFDSKLIDYLKQSKYAKSANNLIYIEYDIDDLNKIIILPYACYLIFTSKKTGNVVTQVVYSIKSNTLKECEQNYMKTFKNKIKDESMKEFLNQGFVIVKNMSLR